MLINLLSSRNFRTYVVGIVLRCTESYRQTGVQQPIVLRECERENMVHIKTRKYKYKANIGCAAHFMFVRRLVLKVLTWQCIALTKLITFTCT